MYKNPEGELRKRLKTFLWNIWKVYSLFYNKAILCNM